MTSCDTKLLGHPLYIYSDRNILRVLQKALDRLRVL